MFGGLGFGETILIFAVFLLLFGAKRLPELASGMVSEALYTLEGARGNRHDTSYGSADVVEEDEVNELRDALDVLMVDGAKHLRSMRPDAKQRIRVTQPRRRNVADGKDGRGPGG